MKRFSLFILVGALFFGLGSFVAPSEVSAATLICSKCDVAYSDREIIQEGKGNERCPAGGNHYFYPGAGNGHPESTKNYRMIESSIHGTWYNESGNCISVIGKYFNGSRILAVHKVTGARDNFDATLVLDGAEKSRELHITVQLAPTEGNSTFSDGSLTPRMYIDNLPYYKK